MLEDLPAYIRSVSSDSPFSLIDELNDKRNLKKGGLPPYSTALLRFALHLRYTSAQAYKSLLEKISSALFFTS